MTSVIDMSLPEYQKLLSRDQGPDLDLEDQSTSYPPTRGVAGGRVVFSYEPVYPRTGDLQHVVGTVGRDQEETKDFIQEYFPSLAKISRDRIIIKMPIYTPQRTAPAPAPANNGNQAATAPQPANKEDWAALTSHTWMTFGTDPPERLAVFVEDAEGEARARLYARDLIPLYVMLGVFACFPFGGFIIWLCGGFNS